MVQRFNPRDRASIRGNAYQLQDDLMDGLTTAVNNGQVRLALEYVLEILRKNEDALNAVREGDQPSEDTQVEKVAPTKEEEPEPVLKKAAPKKRAAKKEETEKPVETETKDDQPTED